MNLQSPDTTLISPQPSDALTGPGGSTAALADPGSPFGHSGSGAPPLDPASIPLRDIHLPDPVSWWPPAPGWWILLSALVMLGIAGWLYLRWFKQRNDRTYLLELDRIERNFVDHQDRHRLARELSVLARHYATQGPSAKAQVNVDEGQIGHAWSASWQSKLEGAEWEPESMERFLTVAPYRPAESFDPDRIIAAFRTMLSNSHKRHKGHHATEQGT